MQTDIDPRHLIGRKAFDRNGNRIGTIDEVYLDDATGVPEWAAIRTGLFSRDAFVPLEPSDLIDGAHPRPLRTRPHQGRPRLRRGPPPLPRAGTPALHHYGLDLAAPPPLPDRDFGKLAGNDKPA
ncbi:PRC-barrel domain-containing protein [Streptomyces heliomycini]